MLDDNDLRELDQLYGTEQNPKGYYDWNREDSNALYIDEKENAIDSLETALQFLNRNDNLKWKWVAFALHHSLYSFCISSLENGNYENVLFKGREDEWIVQVGGQYQQKSEIVHLYIKTYKTPAFRIVWKELKVVPKTQTKRKKMIPKETLIGFWTALARVQDQYFWMGRLYSQKAVQISDEELEQIYWLTEYVRNNLTHFIPKGYAIGIEQIISASKIILEKIEYLVFESFSVHFGEDSSRKRIKISLAKIKEILISELNTISKK